MKRLLYLSIIFSIIFTLSGYAQQQKEERKQGTLGYWREKINDSDANFYQIVEEFDNFWRGKEIPRHSGYKQFKRWQNQMRGRVSPDGKLPPSDEIMNEYNKFVMMNPSDEIPGSWTSLGPHNYPTPLYQGQISGIGRINCVAFHPTNPDIIFAGAPAGGLWKTIDGGISWENLNTDNLPTLGVSSIVIHPTNPDIIYIGTGDRDSFHSSGLGIYKSVNGGNIWVEKNDGLENGMVNKILMEPNSPHILLAATNNGIYKSPDGGDSWAKTDNIYGRVRDMVYKPGSTEILYAEARGGIYKSVDSGNEWERLSEGIEYGHSGAIGVSPDDPERVYFFQTKDEKFTAMYVSYNQGELFEKKTADTLKHEGQGDYNLDIAVDPLNADIVYAGMVTVYKTTNAGDTWGQLAHAGIIHADQHAFEFSPLNGCLYIGNDGGVYSTCNGGDSWNIISDGLVISQIYSMDVGSNNPDQLISGHQDGGTYVTYGNGFFHQNYGDGMNCLIDKNNNNIMYASVQHGDIYRSLTGAIPGEKKFRLITHDSINNIVDSGNWETPYILDQNNSDIMFLGYKDIWRSTNVTAPNQKDVAWENITDSLTSGQYITEIEQSPANGNIMYIVSVNGKVYLTFNALDQQPIWFEINKPESSGLPLYIECHPTDAFTLYMSFQKKIWKSTNWGFTWQDISANLPKIAIRSIVYHENSNEGLFLGTSAGVYYKNADLSQWYLYKSGLPVNVPVRDMVIHYGSEQDMLFAGTFGRGIWKTEILPYYGPNLTIVSGAISVIGNQLEINGVAYNDEPGTDATPFSVGYYLSKNSTISHKDHLIDALAFPNLQNGIYAPIDFEIDLAELPPEVEHGTYYLGAIIDCNHEVDETDEFDNEFTFAEMVEVHTPMQPQNVQASDGTGYWVNLSWEAPPDPLGTVYYRVFRNIANNPHNAEALGSGWQSYNVSLDNTTEGGEDYYYWVKASYNEQGARPSAFSQKDQGWSKLEPPDDVEATQGTYENRIKITWDPIPAATHFKVYRSLVNDPGTAEPLMSYWSSIGNFNDNTALPGTEYFYWARSAMSSTGFRQSEGYSEFTFGFRAWADAPDAFASDGTYDDRIRVTWDEVSGATHYRVYRNTDDDQISAYPVTEWGQFEVLEYDDFDVDPGKYYYYWAIAANNPSGDMPTGFGEGDAGWVRFLPPENLQASDGSWEDYIHVTWQDNNNAAFNKVYRSEFSGYGYAEPYSHWLDANQFFDTDVLPGQTLYYWVKCTNDTTSEFISDFSNEDPGWKKLMPAEVSATKGVYPWSVHVDWEAVEGGLFYKVSKAPVSNPQNISVIMDWTTNPPFHLEPGFEGQYYEYHFYVETARDFSYESPSVGSDIGFAGECGNLADVAGYHEVGMSGTVLTMSHRVVNNGAWPVTESSKVAYFIKEYPNGDDYIAIGERWVSSLIVNQFHDVTHSFDLLDCSENVPLGLYTIAYQLDEEEDICENDETDNFIIWDDLPFEYTNAMFGIYTIGGDAPDFDNFNDAIDAMIDRGIS
ncbi:MAG: hypothetical protein B6D61_04885, partial [Bacteroidetes bacterium 4484_249]